MKTSLHVSRLPPMWRFYIAGWCAYILLVALLVQADAIANGRFDMALILHSAWSTGPSGALLALVWPLTGLLEARRVHTLRLLAVHAGGALAFGVFAHLLMMAHIGGGNRPLEWHAWPFMYSLMSYGLIAGIFHTVRTGAAAQRQALAAQQARTLLVAAELNALRSKLNPHFLFNTLHSIIALTQRNPAAAETALFQFSDMLRYVLDTERAGHDRVTLDAELDFVRDYLELEQLRLGPRLRVEWDLDPEAGGHLLPALTLQPLVENSIKHAFNPHSRPGLLHIATRCDPQDGSLTMTVRDDGPGASRDSIAASSGLGIRTIGRRLLLDYGQGAALDIDSTPGAGFAVSVSIPATTGLNAR
ncbi:sensor histidine kinase [Massilia niastensis]|uniref:sensor histidine kinase n=1 Tax=Massilia niastensis TaxID=544911 RepID=UPI000592DE5D|nr:histidine kinase [Massilia niastensis]